MRWLTLLLFLTTFSYAEDAAKVPDERIAKAIEGAVLLHSEMRDPDSFKLGTVLLAHSDKNNFYAVCFEYYSRNGYGGMNHGYADYSPHSGKDFKTGHFRLEDYEGSAMSSGRCYGTKIFNLRTDVTAEVNEALSEKAAK